jgi:hypothetical protein
MLRLGIGAMVLPASVTYARKWVNSGLLVIPVDISSCGLITNFNTSIPECDDLEDIFLDNGKWKIYDTLFTINYEARACGVRRRGLYDLIISNSL